MSGNFLDEVQRQHVCALIDKEFDGNSDMNLIAISTTDGFSIYLRHTEAFEIEIDKLAALSSALCSLGNASAEQLIKDNFQMATVETASGNVLFLRTRLYGLSCVISMVAAVDMSLAEARFVTKRLSDAIAELR